MMNHPTGYMPVDWCFFHNKLAKTENPLLRTWKWKAYQDRHTHIPGKPFWTLPPDYWSSTNNPALAHWGWTLDYRFCSEAPPPAPRTSSAPSQHSCFTQEQRPSREANGHPAVLKFLSKGKLALFSYLTKSYSSSLNPPEIPCLEIQREVSKISLDFQNLRPKSSIKCT